MKQIYLMMTLVCVMMVSCTRDVVVTTEEPEQITSNSAVLKGSATGDNIKDKGILYCQCETPEINQVGPDWPGWQLKISDGPGSGNFSFDVDLFESNTKYYVRAYAVTDEDVFYGEIFSFVTNPTEVGYINGY